MNQVTLGANLTNMSDDMPLKLPRYVFRRANGSFRYKRNVPERLRPLITQCERTGVPEHFTASLVGHHSARSANKLTYGLYSAGISDEQKREIVEGVKVPDL